MFIGGVALCLLCVAGARGQTAEIDSLLRAVRSAPDDTSRITLLLDLAKAYRSTDRNKALESGRSAVDLAVRLGDARNTGRAQMALGSIERFAKEGDLGIHRSQEAIRLFRLAGDSLLLAEATVELGRSYSSAGQTDSSLTMFENGLRLYNRLTASEDSSVAALSRVGVMESYHYAWVALYFAGRHDEGLALLFEAEREGVRLLGESPEVCNLYNDIGITYRSLGERGKTLEYFSKGFEMAVRIGSYDDRQRLLVNISYEHTIAGDYPRAREKLLEALELQTTPGVYLNPFTLPHLYADLADLETRLGRYTPALDYYLKALRIFENASTPHALADLELSMSDFFHLQGDTAQAIAYLSRARRNFELIGNPLGVSQVLDRLGTLSAEQGRYDDALGHYREGLVYRHTVGDKLFDGLTFYQMGNLFLRKAEYGEQPGSRGPEASLHFPRANASLLDSASLYYTKALEIRGELNDGQTVARCWYGLGQIEALRGDWLAASDAFQRSRRFADSLGMKRELYESYQALANASAVLNRPAEAYRYHRLYSEIKDSVFNERSDRQLKEMQVRYETDRKDKDIELLSREKEVAALRAREQESALTRAGLMAGKRETDLRLMRQAKELREKELQRSADLLHERDLEAKAAAAGMEAMKKDRLLAEHQLRENRLLMVISFVVAGLTIGIGLLIVSRLRLRRELEKREAVVEERRRISAEMHDDLGSNLSTIALLCEVLKRGTPTTGSTQEVEKISRGVQQSLDIMGDIVWSLNPRNDRLENLVAHIRRYTMEYLEHSTVRPSVVVDGEIPGVEVTGENRRNVFLAVKEALHNVVKHSGATAAAVHVVFTDHTMHISIRDDGKGMPASLPSATGNGIVNMKQRIRDAGGEARIETDGGTVVSFTVPLG